MSQFIGEFDTVLREYNNMFDVYYCKDESDAKMFFDTKVLPKELTHLYIIDPKAKKQVNSIISDFKGKGEKEQENAASDSSTKEVTPENQEFYVKKY